ncbi:hypothetical protein H4R33_006775 [Dimargaris cristalligena]|nr:hypothetical protein H4R33_006775 [Dimargaris cristalligena]
MADCASSPISPDHLPKRRTYACHNCRKRKIKCDMTRPNCNNCVRRHATCFYAPQPVPKASKRSYIKSLEDRLEKMELLLEPLHIADEASPPHHYHHQQPPHHHHQQNYHHPHSNQPSSSSTLPSPYSLGAATLPSPLPTASFGFDTYHPPATTSSPSAMYHPDTRSLPPLLPPSYSIAPIVGDPHPSLPPLTAVTAQLPAILSEPPSSSSLPTSPPPYLPPLRAAAATSGPLPSADLAAGRMPGSGSPAVYLAPLGNAPSPAPLRIGRGSAPNPPPHHPPATPPPLSSLSPRSSSALSSSPAPRSHPTPEMMVLLPVRFSPPPPPTRPLDPSSPPPPSAFSLQPSQEIHRQMIVDYFDHFHPHIPFLHKASFIRDVHLGRVYPPILYAMYAIAARVSKRPGVVIQGAGQAALQFRDRARAILNEDYIHPTVDVVTALTMVTLTELMCGDHYKGIQYFDLVVRMALSLQLPFTDREGPPIPVLQGAPDPPILRERIRRLWWIIVYLDTFAAKYTHSPLLIRDDCVAPRLPCPRDRWEAPTFSGDVESDDSESEWCPAAEPARPSVPRPRRSYDGFRCHLELVTVVRQLLAFKARTRAHQYTTPEAFLQDYYAVQDRFTAWSGHHGRAIRGNPGPLTTMDRIWYMSNEIYLNSNIIALQYEIYKQTSGVPGISPELPPHAWSRCVEVAINTAVLLKQNPDISPVQLVGYGPIDVAAIAQVFHRIIRRGDQPGEIEQARYYLAIVSKFLSECEFYWNLSQTGAIVEVTN